MSKVVGVDYSVTIDGNDLSDHVSNVGLARRLETVDLSCMGDGSREKGAALKDGNGSITFKNDWAAGQVAALVDAIFDAGAAVTFILKPTSGAISATNPGYTFSAFVTQWNSFGALAQASEAQLSYEITGDVTRDETP